MWNFRFSWNVDTAQCSVIDSEPLTDLSHASNANAANAAAAAAGNNNVAPEQEKAAEAAPILRLRLSDPRHHDTSSASSMASSMEL